ncbi:MAG: VWA domain-containing protein, partial [Planctomycetota bacterium]
MTGHDSGHNTAPGHLADNLVHFVRALRHAGIRTGPAQLETAIHAVEVAGLRSKEDFYHTLRAVLITRAEDLTLFHQVFQMFWRDPDFLGRMLHLTSPKLEDKDPPPPKAAAHRRASEALQDKPEGRKPPRTREEITRDGQATATTHELLGAMDFEQMSAAELREAEDAVRALSLPLPSLPARRFRTGAQGRRPDPGATFRAAMRRGGDMAALMH